MIGASDLPLDQKKYLKIQKHARAALEKADAYGAFPTRIDDVYAAANIVIADEDSLNDSLIKKYRKQAGSALKRAIEKVWGLFHASSGTVILDDTVKGVQRIFLKLHELGHAMLPWQKNIYAVVEDCEKTIAPDVSDEFDQEANIFASEVLFQIDKFMEHAEQFDFDINVPVKLSKKYGASIYSTVRRYVSKNRRACAVVVLHPPKLIEGDGFRAQLRRVVVSESFKERFGDLNWPDVYTPSDAVGALVPVGKRKMTGKREIPIVDTNGVTHSCIAEAFSNSYQVFVLIHEIEALRKKSFLIV